MVRREHFLYPPQKIDLAFKKIGGVYHVIYIYIYIRYIYVWHPLQKPTNDTPISNRSIGRGVSYNIFIYIYTQVRLGVKKHSKRWENGSNNDARRPAIKKIVCPHAYSNASQIQRACLGQVQHPPVIAFQRLFPQNAGCHLQGSETLSNTINITWTHT